jgi:endoglucanase
MRKRNRKPFAAACFLSIGMACSFMASWPASAEPTALAFRHGISIHHALNWADMQAGAGGQYVFPPFADPEHLLERADLDRIRSAGFDFVRLTIDPGPFLQFEGTRRDALDKILLARINTILQSGLNVVVDFHPNNQNPAYRPLALIESVDTPLFKAYVEAIARTARLLRTLPGERVMLEPMNEPQVGWDPSGNAKWQAMMQSIYGKVRQAAPSLALVVTGGSGGSANGLLALDAAPFASDPRVTFTFHYYLRYEFTHQSIEANPETRFLSAVPYPADSRPEEESFRSLASAVAQSNLNPEEKAAALAAGKKSLTAYFASGFDRSAVNSTFASIADWAARYGVPGSRILLGEFGVARTYDGYRGARDEDRQRWLADIRRAAESRGWGWAVWAFRGPGGMALAQDDRPGAPLDTVALRALGLSATSTGDAEPAANASH